MKKITKSFNLFKLIIYKIKMKNGKNYLLDRLYFFESESYSASGAKRTIGYVLFTINVNLINYSR